ncbi:MAG: aminopeptidase [Candidatus Bipolaricaulota bacterium]|nr:MAG: aminopeptidase [Candidatus Bipolaricaulota bacterium]
MIDSRDVTLANNVVSYSLDLKPGEKVLIDFRGTATLGLLREFVTAVTRAGGVPFVLFGDDSIQRRFLLAAEESQVSAWGDIHETLMREMQCYVRVNGTDNPFDMADIPEPARKWEREHYMQRVHLKIRVPNTKWVVLRYPGNAMAQMAQMSQAAFEDLYFRVCNLDYGRLSRAMDPLCSLMEKTDEVRLKGEGTDLTLSIRDINVVKCDGRLNIPDGEIYTAPVRDSVNGVVTYNAGALYQGTSWDWIRLEFKNGKIAEIAASNDVDKLREVFSSDEGASYIGEFAFGLNPHLHSAIKDTLFDEKIYGSFHTALGQCYEEAPNGNESAIHWDLVCIQTEDYGGGQVWFDGVLVRENGHWVHPDLKDVLSMAALTAEDAREAEVVG